MKRTAVVFDLGKVLVDFDYSIAGRRLAEKSRKGPVEVQKLLDHSPLLFRYESAEITSHDFYSEFCRHAGFEGSFDEFAGCFADIFSEIPEMTRFQADLRRSGVPTYILSNTNEIAVRHVRKIFPFFSNFDGFVLSYEQRALKPHRPIYEAAERVTGRSGRELVFIDDRADNVGGAAALGWHTIQHIDPKETIRLVNKLMAHH